MVKVLLLNEMFLVLVEEICDGGERRALALLRETRDVVFVK